jgi:hypothetical protein
MKQNVLSQTNHYLSNESKARKELIRSLASSTAIETGEPIITIEQKLITKHFSRFPVTLA